MKPERIEFWSDGLRLTGHFYRPDTAPPYPVVVMAGGWCYVKESIQPEYAQFFVDAGVAALTFDYRNLGESEGEPRQHINPWEQIYDIINGVTYVSTRDDRALGASARRAVDVSGARDLARVQEIQGDRGSESRALDYDTKLRVRPELRCYALYEANHPSTHADGHLVV